MLHVSAHLSLPKLTRLPPRQPATTTTQIQIVNQRKQDLERRLKLANNDKSNLSAALEESADKTVHLENLLNERDAKLAELIDEVNELRDSSSWLSNELESMISMNEKLAGAGSPREPADGEQLAGQRKRSQLIDQLKELRVKNQSRLKANEFMLISRRQAYLAGTSQRQASADRRRKLRKRRDASLLEELESTTQSGSSSPDNDNSSASNADQEWREEVVLEVYALLRKFQANLQQRRDALLHSSQAYSHQANQQHLYSPNSADDSGISADDRKFANSQPLQLSRRYCLARRLTSLSERKLFAPATVDKASSSEHEHLEDPANWRRLLESLRLLIEELVSSKEIRACPPDTCSTQA